MTRISYSALTALVILSSLSQSFADSSCQLIGAYTDSDENVYGECVMYNEESGEVFAHTESGEFVYGECYRYSEDAAELFNTYTDDGEYVYGECYF